MNVPLIAPMGLPLNYRALVYSGKVPPTLFAVREDGLLLNRCYGGEGVWVYSAVRLPPKDLQERVRTILHDKEARVDPLERWRLL